MSTCTAPGHPECTITCPNGCIALYWEPDGPCRTHCSGDTTSLQVPGHNIAVSVMISNMPANEVGAVFSEILESSTLSFLQHKGRVTLELNNVSMAELDSKLRQALDR